MIPRLFRKKKSRFVTAVEKITGIPVRNEGHYRAALTHKSHVSFENNERLEFLGDAILDAVISDYLFIKFPKESEGFLSKTRSKIVSREHLNKVAIRIGIPSLMRSDLKEGSIPASLYGNAFEALVGAVYMDHGYELSRSFIYTILLGHHFNIEQVIQQAGSYKSLLLEWGQAEKVTVLFQTKEVQEEKLFTSEVSIADECIANGEGRSKKKAEEKAAKEAVEKLKIKH